MKCDKCGSTDNVTYWEYTDWEGYPSTGEGFYCGPCGVYPYLVTIAILGVLAVIGGIVYLVY